MFQDKEQLIQFTNIVNIDKEYYPKPASKFIPDWYKELDSYIGKDKKPNGKGITNGTVKRCMPVFDAINAGYILVTPADMFISQKDGNPYYEWTNYGLIEFHPVTQAPTHPNRNEHLSYPKFMNFWAIKTPKGYSTLFVQPFHRESPFTILPGIVDTDEYFAPVNFPFVLNDIKFEGLIPAGTPIAQVIPFKRESWKMEIGNHKDIELQNTITLKLKTKMFDSYKFLFRQSKEYK